MDERIPRILHEIPPEKLRELIDTLLGAPLAMYTDTTNNRHELKPGGEQRRGSCPTMGSRA